jgi:hypothetical protein
MSQGFFVYFIKTLAEFDIIYFLYLFYLKDKHGKNTNIYLEGHEVLRNYTYQIEVKKKKINQKHIHSIRLEADTLHIHIYRSTF